MLKPNATRTDATEVFAAQQLWHAARPVDAMRKLAALGCDEMRRRYHLTSWGVSADDAIDFAADSYIADDEPGDDDDEAAWERIPRPYVDRALTAYEDCADFTDSTQLGDEAEESGNYVIGFHAETLATFSADVAAFIRDNASDVEHLSPEAIGHDFWLTRNGHGAGFWDGDYASEVGKRLTDAAHAYGPCDLYLGDDGWVYCS